MSTDRHARKIIHVLCNCECRHAQTAHEAIAELDALVKIAKAARDVVNGVVYPGGDDPYDDLVRALARLDALADSEATP